MTEKTERKLPDPKTGSFPKGLLDAGVVRVTGKSAQKRRENFDMIKRVVKGEDAEEVGKDYTIGKSQVNWIVKLAKGADSKYLRKTAVYATPALAKEYAAKAASKENEVEQEKESA